MRSTIDMAGRLVIPKPIRKRLNLQAGIELEITTTPDGKIELEPILPDPTLVRKGRFVVIQAPEGTPPRTVEETNRLIQESRLARMKDILEPGR